MTFFGLSFSVFPLYFLWGGVGGGWEGLGAESNCKFKPNNRESGQPKKRRIQSFSFLYANYTTVANLREPLPTKFVINFLKSTKREPVRMRVPVFRSRGSSTEVHDW